MNILPTQNEIVSVLRFLFTRPLLKTDIICQQCKGYISLKFNAGEDEASGWVTRKCLCGTSIKYLRSGKEVTVTKDQYDKEYNKRFKADSLEPSTS